MEHWSFVVIHVCLAYQEKVQVLSSHLLPGGIDEVLESSEIFVQGCHLLENGLLLLLLLLLQGQDPCLLVLLKELVQALKLLPDPFLCSL